MPLDPQYLDAIKGFEGYTPRASWDYRQHSVGYGTKARHPGEVIDKDEAERRFQAEMTSARDQVRGLGVPLQPGQEAALASLTYNAGPSWMNAGLGQAVKAGDWNEATKRFVQYNQAGGQALPGLEKRRNQESAWLRPSDNADAEGQSGGFYGQPGVPSAMPAGTSRSGHQVAGYQARDGRMSLGMTTPAGSDPRMAPQPEQSGGLLGGIAKFATNTFTNPLFQAGAAMVNAGSQGRNVGGGFLEGANAASIASERQQADAKRQREVASEQSRAALWQDMVTNPNPAWAKEIDPGTMQLARVMGPVDGMNLIMGLVQKNQVGQLDRMKLEETRRKNDVDAMTAQAQLAEAQNTNADRALTQDTIRRQKEQEIRAQQREAEMEAEIFGRPKPPAPAAPIQPRQIPPPPPIQPRRMSDEVPPQDPMLIPTQAVTPGAATAPVPSIPPATIKIPRNGGEDVSPEVAREFGQKLLSIPKYRSMGQDIIAQADAAMEKKGALSKPAQSEVDKSMVGDINHLARLNDIAGSYNENYLKLAPRLRNSMMGAAEYAGMKVSDADKQNLADFATFRAKTVANFNLLLKEASGAAVTEQELRRMMLQEPNAEANGWLSRPDSPTEFMAKLNNSRTMLVSAIARKNYMRNALNLDDEAIAKLSGMGRMPLGLDQMKDVMGRKQAEVERKIRLENPRIKPEEMPPLVRKEMRGIFGI